MKDDNIITRKTGEIFVQIKCVIKYEQHHLLAVTVYIKELMNYG